MSNFLGDMPLPVNEIKSPGQEHIPCVVMVDTSGSMVGYEKELEEGLQAMKDAILDDDMARNRVEVCLILFNSNVQMEQSFGAVSDFKVPTIKCTGMTATHEAVAKAIEAAEARKQQYRLEKVAYRQPWYWLLTDGYSNDANNGAFDDLRQKQIKRKAVFYGVAIGKEANTHELAGIHKDGIYLYVDKDKFKSVFEFISASMSEVSHSKAGDAINTIGNTKGTPITAYQDIAN